MKDLKGVYFCKALIYPLIAGYLHTRTQPFINKDPNNKYVYITLLITEGGSLIKLYQVRGEAMEAHLALCLVLLFKPFGFCRLDSKNRMIQVNYILVNWTEQAGHSWAGGW